VGALRSFSETAINGSAVVMIVFLLALLFWWIGSRSLANELQDVA